MKKILPRTLLEICRDLEVREGQGFEKNILGTIYCSISLNGRKVQCEYLAKKLDTPNRLYRCLCLEKTYKQWNINDKKESTD